MKIIASLFVAAFLVAASYPPEWYYDPYAGGQTVCPQGGGTSGPDTCVKEIPPSTPIQDS
jgi:hypothetical protein